MVRLFNPFGQGSNLDHPELSNSSSIKETGSISHLVALSSTSGVSWTEGMSTSGKSLDTIPCFDIIVLLELVFSLCEDDGTSSPF